MSFGVSFVCFKAGKISSFPVEPLVSTLHQHGCYVGVLVPGLNEVMLSRKDKFCSSVGDSSAFFMEDGHVKEFWVDRPDFTDRCNILFYSIIFSLKFVMFPDHGGVIYAAAEIFAETDADIIRQFHSKITVETINDLILR